MTDGSFRRVANYAMVAIVSGLLAFVSGLYTRAQANAAVSVRPELADVSYQQALLTNHGFDWLWYHHPDAMMGISVTVFVVAGVVGWWYAHR
jgi:hypothetical protein